MQLRASWKTASVEVIEAKIEQLIGEIYDVDVASLNEETNFYRDLDDSLEIVETVMRCEEEFGIELPDEETSAQNIETVREFKNYIVAKIRTRD